MHDYRFTTTIGTKEQYFIVDKDGQRDSLR